MGQEKIEILNMIKEGIISVDDGVKLLKAVSTESAGFSNDFFVRNIIQNPNALKMKQKIKSNMKNLAKKTERIFEDVSDCFKDILVSSDDDIVDEKNDNINKNFEREFTDKNINNN